MKKCIQPAILEESFDKISDAIGCVSDVADTVQIDVVDGVYAPTVTWPFIDLADSSDVSAVNKGLIREVQRLYTLQTTFELDLMIQNPEDTLGVWLMSDAARFVIHRLSTQYVTYCINRIKEDGREVYIGLTSDDTLSALEPFVEAIDGVQCMGIAQIGKQGEPYHEGIELLIRSIRGTYPDLPIQVDGGVSLQTIPRLLEAGVTQFAVGSALFAGDIEKNFSDLQGVCTSAV